MSEKKVKPITEIFIRSYPKVIFFWPLLVVSFVFWIAQFFIPNNVAWMGNVWLIVLFVNIFVMAFDFSSAKFFVLIMIVVVLVLVVVFLWLPNLASSFQIDFGGINFNITWQFYLMCTIILAFILGMVWVSSRFDYWKIERNEIYHKKGVFSSAERIPTKSLRIKKEIPDVFEFFLLRAGSITLMPGGGDVIPLQTVLNINKVANQIDYLLSYVSVEPDELDGA
jgi:hypothetical protein